MSFLKVLKSILLDYVWLRLVIFTQITEESSVLTLFKTMAIANRVRNLHLHNHTGITKTLRK